MCHGAGGRGAGCRGRIWTGALGVGRKFEGGTGVESAGGSKAGEVERIMCGYSARVNAVGLHTVRHGIAHACVCPIPTGCGLNRARGCCLVGAEVRPH